MLYRYALLAAVSALLIGSSPSGGEANAGVVRHKAGAVQQVLTASETDATTTSSTSYVDVPNAFVRITIPPGPNQLVVARFTAESYCNGIDQTGSWCSVQITINRADTMNPIVGIDYAFDSVEADDGFMTGAAVDRDKVLTPGTYLVIVRYAVTFGSVLFRFDDWHLTVEAAPLS
jgi:hypothetical protein